MAELGYTDGKNFALEFIQLAQPNEWGDAFKELVRRKVEDRGGSIVEICHGCERQDSDRYGRN